MSDSIILKSATKWLLPLLLVFVLLLLLRGHHEPGGGFVSPVKLAAEQSAPVAAGARPQASERAEPTAA